MKRIIFSIILTLCVAALPLYPILAEDNSDAFDGSVNIGFRYADGDDSLNHAAEYDSVDTDGAATVDPNIAAGNDPRFDGAVATNGYHPLWMLASLFAVAIGKGAIGAGIVPELNVPFVAEDPSLSRTWDAPPPNGMETMSKSSFS